MVGENKRVVGALHQTYFTHHELQYSFLIARHFRVRSRAATSAIGWGTISIFHGSRNRPRPIDFELVQFYQVDDEGFEAIGRLREKGRLRYLEELIAPGNDCVLSNRKSGI